ncbi:hypothetical protein [Luteimonas sp. A478]
MPGPVASRWWRWLRGAGPLEILPGRSLPAVLAWLFALGLTWSVSVGVPPGQAPAAFVSALAIEALLVAAVMLVARRRHLLSQALQATGVLAGLRNLVLAPVVALLFLSGERAGAGMILALFVPLGLATVVAMAWLVRCYLALWQQALRTTPAVAGALLLGLALALLLAEAVLARAVADSPPVAEVNSGADATIRLG